MSEITVFISYSHDSEAHRERVLGLSERLRKDGIVTILDRYVEKGSPPEGWPRWMMNGLNAATHVLCVCTETYHRRFLGQEIPGKGKGVDWEGALLTQALYDACSQNSKFIPILFAHTDDVHIPELLRPHTHYVLDSDAGYQALYDALLDQSGVEPAAVGELKRKPRATGQPLSFGASPSGVALATPALSARFDISHFDVIKYAPTELIGREAETKLLNEAWDKSVRGEKGRPHILAFVALGGEGKTSLVAKWAAELAYQDWPGCDAAFAWSFYSQGTRDQAAASSDTFLKEALTFFGDSEMAGSAQGAFDKGRRLAQLVGKRRALLILDGLEPLQYAPTSPTPGELKDHGVAALLKGLAATNHGLCVVTTRYGIPDLRAYWQTTAPETNLRRLSTEAGMRLLKSLGVHGTQKEFEALVEGVKGHALTLNLLGTYLRDAHAGDIRRRDRVRLEEVNTEEEGGHAFHVMDAYVRWFEDETEEDGRRVRAPGLHPVGPVPSPGAGQRALALLSLLGLFDRPATADCLAALLKEPAIPGLTEPLVGLTEAQLNIALTRLESAKLLHLQPSAFSLQPSLDAHPLLREYFAQRTHQQHPEAWRAAHRRLYEHLCATTPDKPQPTLEDLQPLYQAVAHGCQAGMQQEVCEKVYRDRILRGQEAYSVRKLGAFGSDLGAVACFFETPWSRLPPALTEAGKAWLLAGAAFCLRAMGRLTEALEPMRAGLEMHVKQESWQNAAISAGNLSELELTLGKVAGAVRDAEQSVTYADRSGDAFQQMGNRTTHADALYQAGRRAAAEALFCEAEEMQVKRQPHYSLLYSLQGFRYCDLLLTEAERGAWQKMQRSEDRGQRTELEKACCAVSERAAQTLQWVTTRNWLLDIALDHLTLGRAALYAAVLSSDFPSSFLLPSSDMGNHVAAAVDGLRRAGTQDHLPRGLLTRAWLRYLTGARTGPESAQSDLDEAWEIAERGPMRLFLADIHLYRARLFGMRIADCGLRIEETKYPWESPAADLAAAEKLINDCGYHRRDEELADAKKALLTPKPQM